MVDSAVQRKNMVESQVRPSDVTDRRIIQAMSVTPREEFVPSAARTLAYMDDVVPIAPARDGEPARAMMAPRVLAKLLQDAAIESGDVVLDVGSGRGYSAAVIAKLAQTVVALESDKNLADEAARALAALGLDNAAVVTGDLTLGYRSEGPYDVIVLEGAVEVVPLLLLDQLRDGGRLVAVVQSKGVGKATIWRRMGALFDSRESFDANAPALPGFGRDKSFVF